MFYGKPTLFADSRKKQYNMARIVRIINIFKKRSGKHHYAGI